MRHFYFSFTPLTGDSSTNIIDSSVHLPCDHNPLVQNLTGQNEVHIFAAIDEMKPLNLNASKTSLCFDLSFDKELTDPQTFYVKKAKRNPLVEVGTKIRDASMDEWLQSSSSLVYLFSGSQSSSCNCPLTSHCLPYDGDDQGN
ncbi:hypothetical protein SAY86_007565 [Trapa natans]|uniref:Uncharacterized protein n=1 Tax=Trapa natans TaxID=22666 RepID=A0AAN7LBX2_TRANT|nr:hypothetical protein SAY86_007565 [Trapa natans]